MSEMGELIKRARSLNPEYLYGSLVHELADEIARLRGRLDKIAKHPDTPELLRQYALGMF